MAHKEGDISSCSLKNKSLLITTVLNAIWGYWQVQPDNNSSRLCIFSIPSGKCKFTRLPFGSCSAPGVHQQVI